jgi:hypothetical protein
VLFFQWAVALLMLQRHCHCQEKGVADVLGLSLNQNTKVVAHQVVGWFLTFDKGPKKKQEERNYPSLGKGWANKNKNSFEPLPELEPSD